MKRIERFVAMCAAMAAGLPVVGSAADLSWTLETGSGSFADAANWGGTAPVAGDALTMAQAGSTATIASGDEIAYGSLAFTAGFIEMTGGTVTTTSTSKTVGTTTTTYYQTFGSTSGDATDTAELQMSGGLWTTSSRLILGYATGSGTFDAVISGGTSTSERTTMKSTGQYMIVGNGGSTVNVTLNDYAELYGDTTSKVIVADGTGNTATLNMNDSSNLYSKTRLDIGWNGGNGTVVMGELGGTDAPTISSDGSIYVGASSSSNGSLTMNASSQVTTAGLVMIGNSSGTGSLTMNDNSVFNAVGTEFNVGRDGSGVGSVVMNGSSTMTLGNLYIARYTSSSTASTFTMNGNSQLTSGGVYVSYYASGNNGQSGKLIMTDDAQITATSLVIADKGNYYYGGNGELDMSGNSKVTLSSTGDVTWGTGAATVTANLSGSSQFNASGMKLKLGDSGASDRIAQGSVTLGDSAAMTLRELTIGHYGGGDTSTNWTVTVGSESGSGNAKLTATTAITLGRDDNSTGTGFNSTLNINKGTVATTNIRNGGGTGAHVVNVNGGTIQALANTDSFFNTISGVASSVVVNIEEGGLTFDTGEYSVGISNSLDGEGGLTKTGLGSLYLLSENTYAGDTLLQEGTLGFSVASLSDGADVYLETGTVLALDFEGTDAIRFLYIDGVQQEAGQYDSSTLGDFITGDGALIAVPEPATLALALAGLGVIAFAWRKREKRA